MKWVEVQSSYRDRWVLVEALQAHSVSDHRYLDDVSVVGSYTHSSAAMQAYSQLHRQRPQAELYVLHTSRDEIEIEERLWLGVRALP